MPTLISEALGCTTPTDQYSNGVNLLKPHQRSGTVIYSYAGSAYLVGDTIVEKYSLEAPYAWSDVKRRQAKPPSEAIKTLIADEARFMR